MSDRGKGGVAGCSEDCSFVIKVSSGKHLINPPLFGNLSQSRINIHFNRRAMHNLSGSYTVCNKDFRSKAGSKSKLFFPVEAEDSGFFKMKQALNLKQAKNSWDVVLLIVRYHYISIHDMIHGKECSACTFATPGQSKVRPNSRPK